MRKLLILLLLLPVLVYPQTAKKVRTDTLAVTHVATIGGSNVQKASDTLTFDFTRTQFNTEILNYVALQDSDSWLPSWADINAKGYLVFMDSTTFLAYVKYLISIGAADSSVYATRYFVGATYAPLASPTFTGIASAPVFRSTAGYDSITGPSSAFTYWHTPTGGAYFGMEPNNTVTLVREDGAFGDFLFDWAGTHYGQMWVYKNVIPYGSPNIGHADTPWTNIYGTNIYQGGVKVIDADDTTGNMKRADTSWVLTKVYVDDFAALGHTHTGVYQPAGTYLVPSDTNLVLKRTDTTWIVSKIYLDDLQPLDADLTDLADGTLTGSKVQTFGTSNAGVVGQSGGGTTNYLRADGSWAAPAGSGGIDSARVKQLISDSLNANSVDVSGTPVAGQEAFWVNDTTLGGRDRPFINVMDAPFSAVRDGVTNDKVAIQRAIDSGYTQNRAVYLPAGTYAVGAHTTTNKCLNLKPGTVLFGDGDKTIIQRVIVTGDTSGYLIGYDETTLLADSTLNNFTIRDLQIKGASSGLRAGYTSTGADIDGGIGLFRDATPPNQINRVLIENVTARNFAHESIAAWDAWDVTIRNCRVYNAGHDAFNPARSKKVTVTNCVVDSAWTVGECTLYPVYQTTRLDTVTTAVFSGNNFTNIVFYGITVHSGDNIAITGNVIRGIDSTVYNQQAHGVYISNYWYGNGEPAKKTIGSIVVSGNEISGMSGTGIGNDGQTLRSDDATIKSILISGNSITNTAAQAICFRMYDSTKVRSLAITGNTISGWDRLRSTGGILYSGIRLSKIDSTVISENKIWNDRTTATSRHPLFLEYTTGTVVRDNDFRSRETPLYIQMRVDDDGDSPRPNTDYHVYANLGLDGLYDYAHDIVTAQENPPGVTTSLDSVRVKQLIADSVNARANDYATPTHTHAGVYVTPADTSAIRNQSNALYLAKATILLQNGTGTDSVFINTTYRIPLGYSTGIVLDSIVYVGLAGSARNIQCKIAYGTDQSGAGTLVDTTTVTSNTAITKQSGATVNQATIPAGNFMWLEFPIVWTGFKTIVAYGLGHRL